MRAPWACVRVRVGESFSSAAALADDTTSAALQAVLSAVGRVEAVEKGAVQSGLIFARYEKGSHARLPFLWA